MEVVLRQTVFQVSPERTVTRHESRAIRTLTGSDPMLSNLQPHVHLIDRLGGERHHLHRMLANALDEIEEQVGGGAGRALERVRGFPVAVRGGDHRTTSPAR